MTAKTALEVVKEAAVTSGQFADGVYFDLDEEAYHLDLALGSTDHRKLLTSPADYWFASPLNPNRPADKDTPARARGRAMHKLVLEGQASFDALYMRGPDHTEDMTPAEKSAATKAVKAQAAKLGREVLPADVYDRVAIASAMITRNPKLAMAFTGGAPEVSVFWTRDGVRRKARLDYLKPRGIGDLKSVVNMREIPFKAACRNAIANYRYEMQAALYIEARSMIPKFFADGLVFPSTDADKWRDILRKCAEAKAFAFQFVFFQAEGAPITWSTILSPANPIFEIAQREVNIATDNYQNFMEQFGPDKMWLELDEPQELAMEEMPAFWGRN
jgi:hypothetical protein